MNTSGKNLTGLNFGRLKILNENDERSHGNILWDCLCSCGNKPTIQGRNLTSGKTKSCGCLALETLEIYRYKHGMSHTKENRKFRESKRRSAKLQRTPKWLTEEDFDLIREIYQFCPENFEVDHIIPLQGKNVSGLHTPNNLQYLYAPLNRSKSNNFNTEYSEQ